ncbi:hypothetical protein Phi46:3_gp036 [Cellulophaga phage phi46:3]|uniref:Uncharacterized protein n=1 Tax=Cellulophaga phage phi46:3 TaxID=1327985 RepID=S0A1U6_9CAUD|nr:hypothetical protein Phi46:3_gp036 [Cellulophaga phage phi46:3]AGO48780.1 hypothetical protein Phi46:3_gp036 [Cellulophaga phage phi46:3]
MINKFIDSGYNFKRPGYSIPLTKEDVRHIYLMQSDQLNVRRSGFDKYNDVSISENEFKLLYEESKSELSWFWDKDPIKYNKRKITSFPYYDLAQLEEALSNCENRIKEINQHKK